MQRGKQEIFRLLEAIRREIRFDVFNLTNEKQEAAEFRLQQLKEFIDGLYPKD